MLSPLAVSTRPTRRAAAATAAGGLAVLLAAGCSSGQLTVGGSGHPAAGGLSPAQAITLAAHQAQQVNSFAGTLSVKMSGRTTGTVSGTMQMRQRPSLLADVNFSTLDIAGHNMAGGAQEIISSRAMYMKMPALQAELGKPWLRMTFSELKGASGVNLGQLIQQTESDSPLLQTQMLAAAKNVKVAGTQTIDGVKTTEYTGSYPMSAALAKLPASVRGQVQQHLQSMSLTSAQFRVWIDAQHQTRKVIVIEHGGAQQMTMNALVTGINQPVKVALPPASQVKTIPASALGG
jgi:hypothetical protein